MQDMGSPVFTGGDDPAEELIATILSANTNDTNSGRAFNQLMLRFDGDLDAIRTAPAGLPSRRPFAQPA